MKWFACALSSALLCLGSAAATERKAQVNSDGFVKISTQLNSDIFFSSFNIKKPSQLHVFEKKEGQEIGLHQGFQYDIRDYTDPFWIGRGTASGDYDNDGWQDVILGSDNGFILYKNIGGKFELQTHTNEAIIQQQVYAVAFVDFNNDGWLDIFYTTFNNGNYLIQNRQGIFDFQDPQRIPNNDAVLTLSPAFADLDNNGLIDILNGNIALGVVTGSHHMLKGRNNSIVFNGGTQYRNVELETTSGETMATLISDINNDDVPDLYMGNDFFIPDKVLLGTGNGYTEVKGNKFIPYTPFFSMGADSGDLNNDLNLDLVIMGTMTTAHEVGRTPIDNMPPESYTRFKGDVGTCKTITEPTFRDRCQNIRNTRYIEQLDSDKNVLLTDCEKINNQLKKDTCLTQVMWQLITNNPHIDDCAKTFEKDAKLKSVCNILKLRIREYKRRDMYGSIPQDDRNMLYLFDDATKTFQSAPGFKHPGAWTWNTRIVDLDNDGWQDIFNAEGAVRKSGYGWNVFMKNMNGHSFEQRQFSYNLTDNFGLYSYTLIDMDNDGDLDIIGNSSEGPVQVYVNHSTANNHSIAISLVDSHGNRNGIGAKITIHYNDGKEAQIREIKASGGYQSFDPAIAYFGLGRSTTIEKIKVIWPDRTQTSYDGPFNSDGHYKILRH